MDDFLLDVPVAELTRALKHLCKSERQTQLLHLIHNAGLLNVSIGGTRQDVPANGAWPDSISVHRIWAETIIEYPFDVAIITLRVSGEKLWTRDWSMDCSLANGPVADEDAVKRRADVAAAAAALWRQNVTEQEIEQILNGGSR